MNDHPVRGVWCATLTPLQSNGEIDGVRFRDHVAMLLAAGVNGIAPFGTTGEGQSFSVAERCHGINALIRAGVDPLKILPATGCAAITDTIALTRHAVGAGCAGALILPPFFFKGVDDEGVFASYARLIDGVNDSHFHVYLYHIPQVTNVPISHAVIERLLAAFPGVIAGVKDSSGVLENSLELVHRFPSLDILVGHEPHLPQLLAAGGAGTICGLANLYPHTLRRLHDAATNVARAADLQFLEHLLDTLKPYSLMPALKGVRAILADDPAWHAVREPLLALDDNARRSLAAAIGALATPKIAA